MLWMETLRKYFPAALQFDDLARIARNYLWVRGYSPDNTLFASATCRDEANQTPVALFARDWGEHFELAGLGGFPSAGRSGFAAYAAHSPDDGHLFILFGPHIGIGTGGELGQVARRGMRTHTACCGSLCDSLTKLADKTFTPQFNDCDVEQFLVDRVLVAARDRILSDETPLFAAVNVMYEAVEERLLTILDRLSLDTPVALLGGVVINTPFSEVDHFEPRLALELVPDAPDSKSYPKDWLQRLVPRSQQQGE